LVPHGFTSVLLFAAFFGAISPSSSDNTPFAALVLGLPFLICGGLKATYDMLLYGQLQEGEASWRQVTLCTPRIFRYNSVALSCCTRATELL
jgi:hypothetical protein